MIKWEHVSAGEYEGVGSHAHYYVHQLTERHTGSANKRLRKWMTARKLGVNPIKIIGGPYPTAKEAMQRANSLEAAL